MDFGVAHFVRVPNKLVPLLFRILQPATMPHNNNIQMDGAQKRNALEARNKNAFSGAYTRANIRSISVPAKNGQQKTNLLMCL